RAVFEDFTYRVGQDGGNGQDGEVLEAFLLWDRQGIGDDDFTRTGMCESFGCWIGEDRVGRRADDFGCASVLEDLDRTGNRAGGVNHVVNEHAGASFDLTDYSLGFGFIGLGEVM